MTLYLTDRKLNNAFARAGITMPSVRAHIEREIMASVDNLGSVTTKQLTTVILLIHSAYAQGRASCGASIEGDAVWIGDGVDKLIPLEVIKQIEVTRTIEPHLPASPAPGGWTWPATNWSVTHYKLDATERL